MWLEKLRVPVLYTWKSQNLKPTMPCNLLLRVFSRVTKGTLPVLYVTYQYCDLFRVNIPQLRL